VDSVLDVVPGVSSKGRDDADSLRKRRRLLFLLVVEPATLFEFASQSQAIDATGFDRRAASRRYAKRTNYTFTAVKTTVLVDCQTSKILDIHCSMERPHDTQIGEQVLTRNLDQVDTITADKGYDWDELRGKLREEDVRPVIKHREFSSLNAAHNARLDDETYHRRSVVESVIRSLKRRFGDTLRARTCSVSSANLRSKLPSKISKPRSAAKSHDFEPLNRHCSD